MRKVLYAARDLYPAVGGAAVSVLALLKALCVRGYEVHALCSDGGELEQKAFDDEGVQAILAPDFVEALPGVLEEFAPDMLLTQGWGADSALVIAKQRGLPVVLQVVDLIQLTPQRFCDQSRIDFGRNLELYARADLLLANSNFTRRRLREMGLASTVVYPMVEPGKCIAATREPRYLTLASGLRHKGVEMFIEQAPNLPLPCLVCGGIEPDLREVVAGTPNIHYIGFARDMRPVYAQTQCLLMLSQLEETFGMVMVEANLNGVPVAALDRGAVRETAGQAGAYFSAPAELPDAVRRATAIPAETCQRNARRFDASIQADRFAALLESLQ